jgi:hypothetical protein
MLKAGLISRSRRRDPDAPEVADRLDAAFGKQPGLPSPHPI